MAKNKETRGRKKKYDFDKLLKNGNKLRLPFSTAARVTAHSWARRSGKKVLTERDADEILIWLKQ